MSEPEHRDAAAEPQDPWDAVLEDRSRDWFLREVVSLAEDYGVGFNISIVVGGRIISGEIISAAMYMEGTIAGLRDGPYSEDHAGIIDAISKKFEAYRKGYSKPEDAHDDYRRPPASFLHLRGAEIIQSHDTSIIYQEPALWRFKLEQVQGFSLVKTEAATA